MWPLHLNIILNTIFIEYVGAGVSVYLINWNAQHYFCKTKNSPLRESLKADLNSLTREYESFFPVSSWPLNLKVSSFLQAPDKVLTRRTVLLNWHSLKTNKQNHPPNQPNKTTKTKKDSFSSLSYNSYRLHHTFNKDWTGFLSTPTKVWKWLYIHKVSLGVQMGK